MKIQRGDTYDYTMPLISPTSTQRMREKSATIQLRNASSCLFSCLIFITKWFTMNTWTMTNFSLEQLLTSSMIGVHAQNIIQTNTEKNRSMKRNDYMMYSNISRNCEDNSDFKFLLDFGNRHKKCSWINTEQRKARYCAKDNVRTQCSLTCNSCSGPTPTPAPNNQIPCEDNSDFKFRLNNTSNKRKKCSWIMQSASKATQRKKIYCAKDNVRSQCQLTCDSCSGHGGGNDIPFVRLSTSCNNKMLLQSMHGLNQSQCESECAKKTSKYNKLTMTFVFSSELS